MATLIEPRFRLGQRVRFERGGGWAEAIVLEDRGPLGVGGRKLYRVRGLPDDPYESFEIELPADELESLEIEQP